MSAKAQVGRKRPGEVGANRSIWRVIKIADGIGRVVVNGRGHHALLERHGTGHDLDAPVAPIMWPVIDLVDETCAARAASSPSARFMPAVSDESLSLVEVP